MATIDPYEGQATRRLAARRAYRGHSVSTYQPRHVEVFAWAVVVVGLVLAAIGAATVIGWVVSALG